MSSKILELGQLAEIRLRKSDAKIVHCHGVFDVLHAGHLAYFETAKKMGDFLVVSVTSDAFVNKGPGRPFFNSAIRAKVLASLEIVDAVVVSDYPTATVVIEAVKPDFYVKGPDYSDKAKDLTGGIIAEEEAVEKWGGKLHFTGDETFSSSKLLNLFFHEWSEDQRTHIQEVRQCGGLSAVMEVLDLIQEKEICVIGEPIVDTYSFCNPDSISSKNPCVSARFLQEENYAGGSLAIANHLSDFVKRTTLVFTHGGEEYFRQILAEKVDPRVKIEALVLPKIPTPRKTRYIGADRRQRLFELTNLRNDQWVGYDPAPFAELMKTHAGAADVVKVVADFGHGLFEGEILRSVGALPGYLGLNVQTNSSNFGFNPFTKHRHFSFLGIDVREARIAHHDRFAPAVEILRRMQKEYSAGGASIAMTLGADGAHYFPRHNGGEFYGTAFADNVVDATGAGDAFFGLASLCDAVDCPPPILLFLGNVFAGLKTKIIGNKSAVTRAQLVKAVAAILK